MPLDKSGSKESVGKNIKAERKAGKSKDQSLAIALEVQRRAKMAKGGDVPIPGVPSNTPNATNFAGYIHGTSGGRTDNKPMKVAPGSYVIPSDILSGLGQGNSHAGAAALQRMFKMGPHAKTLGESGKFADGGMPGEGVPIVAASGEMVIDPETVASIGNGDQEVGHKILDKMVEHVRKSTIAKLKKLPPPKRS